MDSCLATCTRDAISDEAARDLTMIQAFRLLHVPPESGKKGTLRSHGQVAGWNVHETSPWRMYLRSVLALESRNLRQTCRDLCLRVVFLLVKLDTFRGTDAEKAGPHALLETSPTWRRSAAVLENSFIAR